MGLEFGDVFADNRPVAQQLVDVALMPHRLPCVPCRDTFFDERPGDDATPVATHVHVEDATNELRTLFEHMNLAVAHFNRAENGEIPPGSMLVVESLDRLTRNCVNPALKLLLDITQLGKIGLTAQNVILDLASYAAFFPILADMMRSNSESEHKSFRPLANWQTKRKLAKTGVIVTSQVPRWLEEAAERAGRCVVATECRDADVLQGFGDRQAMGFDKPHGSVVLPTFIVAPGLALR